MGLGRRGIFDMVAEASFRLWDRVNTVYAESFTSHRPARVVVPTPELHFGFQIEVAAIAACDKDA